MSGGLKCKECDNEINYKANLPRILICCGYTTCHECLTNILITSKRCPSCKKVTQLKDANEYFVNIALLDIKNEAKDHCRVTYYQECRKNLIQRKNDFEKLRPQLQATIAVIDSKIKDIRDFQGQLGDMSDPDVIKANMQSFATSYSDVAQYFSVIPITVRTVDMRSQNYHSSSDYLTAIKTPLSLGKPVAALLTIKSIKAFAPLTLMGKRLCVYAFIREVQKPNVPTVCLRDLQDVLLRDGVAKSVYAFLQISGKPVKTLLIKMFKSKSYLGSQFLKFCSGEFGRRYKGENCTNSEDYDMRYFVKVNSMGWEMDEQDNYAKYFLEKDNYSIMCNPENCYVHMGTDGSFDIFKCKKEALKRDGVVGQVVDFEGDLESITSDSILNVIEDSGVAYDIE